MNENKKHSGNISLLGGRPCLDFVNTLDWRGTDQPVEYLKTYQDLVLWSQHVGTISNQEAEILSRKSKVHISEQTKALAKALNLREVIYRIFSSLSAGKWAMKKDIADFNQYLTTIIMDSQIIKTKEGYIWDTKGNREKPDWILNPLIRSAADLLVSDELKRVKECGNQACGWLFFDTSRNKSRRWCHMGSCGNRAKASRFYKKNSGSRSQIAV